MLERQATKRTKRARIRVKVLILKLDCERANIFDTQNLLKERRKQDIVQALYCATVHVNTRDCCTVYWVVRRDKRAATYENLIFEQVRHKPVCIVLEKDQKLEILDLKSRKGIVLF